MSGTEVYEKLASRCTQGGVENKTSQIVMKMCELIEKYKCKKRRKTTYLHRYVTHLNKCSKKCDKIECIGEIKVRSTAQ